MCNACATRVQHFRAKGTTVRNLIRGKRGHLFMMLLNIIKREMVQKTIKRRSIMKHHDTSCDIMRYHVTTPRPHRDARFTPAHCVKLRELWENNLCYTRK